MSALVRDLAEGIRGQPGRYALSFFAVVIGIVSLTLLIAILDALKQKSRQLTDELGANVVAIMDESGPAERHIALKNTDATFIKKNFPNLMLSTIRRNPVRTLGTEKKLAVIATDPLLPRIRGWQVRDGRFFDRGDLDRQERHVVITHSLSERWNWRVGHTILLNEIPFLVIGIIEVSGERLDSEYGDARLLLGERVVFVPKTLTPWWVNQGVNEHNRVDAIFVREKSGAHYQQFLKPLKLLVTQPDRRIGRIAWITPASLRAKIERLQNIITITVGTVAVLCLVLGGTTLMSLMVANVRDRVAEVGLRRAFGARRRDIAVLFVAEACVITIVAGLAGTLIAQFMLIFAVQWLPFPVQANSHNLLVPTLVATAMGILFSWWPARMAANIEPAAALRYE